MLDEKKAEEGDEKKDGTAFKSSIFTFFTVICSRRVKRNRNGVRLLFLYIFFYHDNNSPSADEDENAPLNDGKKKKTSDDGEEGIEQKKKKKKEVAYPRLDEVSDASQYASSHCMCVSCIDVNSRIVKYSGIKFLVFFAGFILAFIVYGMPRSVCSSSVASPFSAFSIFSLSFVFIRLLLAISKKSLMLAIRVSSQMRLLHVMIEINSRV